MQSTKDVLDHHLSCFGEGNLEGILADYSSDAILFMPTGPLRGIPAIKPIFQAIFAEFGQPGTSFVLHQRWVEGNYAFILWAAETADNHYDAATDTFVVQDGKIVAQSFGAKITPKR
jgi:ketosteroid isomerase-like protein